ncbi:oleate-activated transcription factor 1 [Fusarium mundagurra]|uniref:Oleate-activated transcription factor 1 n=1 Tax=Fusarium mundagurra TaxID=1567541 RepID=A0A8H5Z4A2_9HYPO|nr:oleate-activated transcription factor 1 [Fusarium mundagurra]
MSNEPSQTPTTNNPSRRQALNACEACRKRKTKCDEKKPTCARCTRLGLECMYIETVAAKKNLSIEELTGTLKRMDEKLDVLTAFAQHQAPTTGLASTPGDSYFAAFSPLNLGSTGVTQNASTPFLDTGRVLEELSLSQRHSTAPQHLLTWPCSTLQMSEPDLQYPMDLEINRPSLSRSTAPPRCLEPPPSESWLSRLSLSQVSLLTQSYFQHFHPSCLILNESLFYSQVLSNAVQTNFAPNYSSCTVLLVCSLGSIVAHYAGHEEWSSGNEQDIGLGFFNLANDMFRNLERCNWESVQCLLLMGQILAEFDFPASGLGKLASSMPLPVVPGAGTDPSHAQYQFFFLALISMRKLLNRILFHLYSRDHTEDPANGEPAHADKPAAFLSVTPSVMFELDRQLEEWRTCLPQGLEFLAYSEAQLAEVPELDQTHRSTNERLRGHLMARYFAAKSIIHRPYIYKTLHHGATASLSDADAAGARTAVGSALMSVFICM